MVQLRIRCRLGQRRAGGSGQVERRGAEPGESLDAGRGYHCRIVGAECRPRDEHLELVAPGQLGKALAQVAVGSDSAGNTDNPVAGLPDDLLDAVASIQLSKKVMGRIRGNIFWAFAYNSALIPVAAGVLYPFFGITFRPELAAFAMALSSVTVVSLSLLLKRYIPEAKKGR